MQRNAITFPNDWRAAEDECTQVLYLRDTEKHKNVRVIRYQDGRAIFEQKTLVENIDQTVLPFDSKYTIRFSHKIEKILEKQVPLSVADHVRIRCRQRFIYRGQFAYDFTTVFQGKHVEEARDSLPRFEIEIELLKTAHANGAEHIAKSLLAKMYDLAREPDKVLVALKNTPPNAASTAIPALTSNHTLTSRGNTVTASSNSLGVGQGFAQGVAQGFVQGVAPNLAAMNTQGVPTPQLLSYNHQTPDRQMDQFTNHPNQIAKPTFFKNPSL